MQRHVILSMSSNTEAGSLAICIWNTNRVFKTDMERVILLANESHFVFQSASHLPNLSISSAYTSLLQRWCIRWSLRYFPRSIVWDIQAIMLSFMAKPSSTFGERKFCDFVKFTLCLEAFANLAKTRFDDVNLVLWSFNKEKQVVRGCFNWFSCPFCNLHLG